MASLGNEKYLQNQPKTLPRITWLFSHPVVLKMGHPRPLFRLFSVFFKQTLQILEQFHVKIVSPVYEIRTHGLHNISLLPKPLDQGSPPTSRSDCS